MSKIMESINAVQERQDRANGMEPAGEELGTPVPVRSVQPNTFKIPSISNIIIFTLIIFLIAFQALSLMQLADRSSRLDKDIKNAVLLISDMDNKGNNIEGSLKSALDEVALLKDQIKGMQDNAASLGQKIEDTTALYKGITESVDKIAKSSKSNADYLMIIDKRIDQLAAEMTRAQEVKPGSVETPEAEAGAE
ncbi:MAG: hypothetical protein WC779_03510 [Candidatus Omnitrophota bacterium]|jgi:methyl-accepting chemotaxis protein